MNLKEGTDYNALKNETEYFSFFLHDPFSWEKEGIAVVINEDIRESLYYKIWGE